MLAAKQRQGGRYLSTKREVFAALRENRILGEDSSKINVRTGVVTALVALIGDEGEPELVSAGSQCVRLPLLMPPLAVGGWAHPELR